MLASRYNTVYCLFCRSGREAQIGQEIERKLDGIRALNAVQEKHRYSGGRYEIDRRVFLPGYLFLYSEGSEDLGAIRRMDDIYRILGEECGAMELQGSDKAFADWLFENDGVVGISKIRYVDGTMEILSGPMRRFVKEILKVDKHTRNAQVRMDFLGKQSEIWLAFEFADEK